MGLLGAHVSVAGGFDQAVQRGEDLGCQAIQIFSKNQKQWTAPPLSDQVADAFRLAFDTSSIQSVVIHDSYLINLASPDPDRLKKSRQAFLDEMQRADKLGVSNLVFHPGSHMKTSKAAGVKRIIDSLNWALDQQPEGDVTLLIETTAGQGDHLGFSFEQVAEMISQVEDKDRIGVCFDTAHVFAAGYDMRSEKSYTETMTVLHQVIGLDRIKVIHLNDSKSDLGSRVDRHANIGQGLLGETPFRLLVNDSRFQDVPMILETPDDGEGYRKTLTLLQSYIH